MKMFWNLSPLFLVSIPILVVLDFLFFAVCKSMFEKQIFDVQKSNLRLRISGGLACYFFLFLGLFYFIFKDRRSPLEAMVLGFVIYGVFETTSYALLEKWKLKTALIDISWGGILFYLSTYATYDIVSMNK